MTTAQHDLHGSHCVLLSSDREGGQRLEAGLMQVMSCKSCCAVVMACSCAKAGMQQLLESCLVRWYDA